MREQKLKLHWTPKEIFFFFSLVDQSSWRWRMVPWPLIPFVIEHHCFILSLSCLKFTGVKTNIIISSLCSHIYTKEVFQKRKLYSSNCFLLCWGMFKIIFWGHDEGLRESFRLWKLPSNVNLKYLKMQYWPPSEIMRFKRTHILLWMFWEVESIVYSWFEAEALNLL